MNIDLDAIAKIAVPIINGLVSLFSNLPGLVDRIRSSSDLSTDGAAWLDAQQALLLERKRRAEEIAANPLPAPKPTAPG